MASIIPKLLSYIEPDQFKRNKQNYTRTAWTRQRTPDLNFIEIEPAYSIYFLPNLANSQQKIRFFVQNEDLRRQQLHRGSCSD